ncbi:hypothetical protein IF1G_07975 [Cordyceps javanica]|uniref:Uncharacterized protein n=1 Tax=Cordyceps javanica TaxID=43265 RepID=A0A545UVA4_9HYPO|nr:hypothetical protein IF1G_07975 [Cordyceps javanica]TQW05260.1 hypothetical protein IF2G_07197 [Cordyceps javanica]
MNFNCNGGSYSSWRVCENVERKVVREGSKVMSKERGRGGKPKQRQRPWQQTEQANCSPIAPSLFSFGGKRVELEQAALTSRFYLIVRIDKQTSDSADAHRPRSGSLSSFDWEGANGGQLLQIHQRETVLIGKRRGIAVHADQQWRPTQRSCSVVEGSSERRSLQNSMGRCR